MDYVELIIFVLHVHLLQTILNEAMLADQAPLESHSNPNFPVIQYADDTILIQPAIQNQVEQVNNLSETL